MRALVYTAVRSVEMQEWREPEPGNNEVLVRVRAAAICGSDVHGFLGYSKIRVPPMVMGHEFTGEILALGSGVSELAVGDRVVVQPLVTCMRCPACLSGRTNICQDRKLLGGHLQGGFAERIVAPRHLVYRLPDHVSYEAGSLTEPLANAVHMARLAPPAFADVAVFGAGTLGLAALQAFRVAGARRVVVLDTAADRLAVASRLGADAVVNPREQDPLAASRAVFGGASPAIVVDAVGYTIARQQGLALVAPGGTVVLLGLGEALSELDFLSAINREVRLQGSYSSDDQDFRGALSLIADGRVDVTSWAEHFAFEQGQSVFTRLADNPAGLVKAVFVPQT